MQSVTLTRPPRARSAPLIALTVVVAVLVLVPFGWLLVNALREPAFVDEVVVVNPNEFDVNVRVAGEDGRQLVLGPVEGDSTSTFRSVIDQGGVWVFQFERAGERIGDVRVDRSTLESDGWRVEVPAGRPGSVSGERDSVGGEQKGLNRW